MNEPEQYTPIRVHKKNKGWWKDYISIELAARGQKISVDSIYEVLDKWDDEDNKYIGEFSFTTILDIDYNGQNRFQDWLGGFLWAVGQYVMCIYRPVLFWGMVATIGYLLIF